MTRNDTKYISDHPPKWDVVIADDSVMYLVGIISVSHCGYIRMEALESKRLWITGSVAEGAGSYALLARLIRCKLCLS